MVIIFSDDIRGTALEGLACIKNHNSHCGIAVFDGNFAEKFLGCDIDNIIYGQANFVDGKPVNTKIWDMVPLFYLNTVTNTIHCDTPEKARKTLKSLLSL